MGITIIDSRSLLEAVEDRLTGSGAGLSLTLSKRIELHAAEPKQLAHRLCAVSMPSTRNEPRSSRQRGWTVVGDEVLVEVTYRVNPHEQRDSRGDAIELEQSIIERMTGYSSDWHHQVVYVRSRRGPHPSTPEYYLLQVEFNVRRQAALGGA